MAVALRRHFSFRNLLFLRNPNNGHLITFSHLSSFGSETPLLQNPQDFNCLAFDLFHREIRRGFSKGKKSTAISQMEAAISALSRVLSKLRTGRASAGILDHIIVETNGLKMPLNHVAVVSVIDSQTLSVTPYDPDALKKLVRAIVSSPLGLNPALEGQRLVTPIPPLTKEHTQAICKVVAKSSEDVKQSIRRARQKWFCSWVLNVKAILG